MFNNIINLIAVLSSMGGYVLLRKKNEKCFLILTVGNISIVYLALNTSPVIWSSIILSVLYIGLNINTYFKWKNEIK